MLRAFVWKCQFGPGKRHVFGSTFCEVDTKTSHKRRAPVLETGTVCWNACFVHSWRGLTVFSNGRLGCGKAVFLAMTTMEWTRIRHTDEDFMF